jgi:predicted Zn-dependent protease
MKRYLPLALILASGCVAILFVQREHINTQPGPQTLLTAAADAQHELTRMPARLDRMTDAEEIAIGNALAKGAATSWNSPKAEHSHDAATEAYLQAVGSRVAVHARRKLPWTFHYIPSPEFVNAFALPGGHVFVGQGLMKQMQSEDALAAVLGHEVEHIDLRHCAERIQAEARLRQFGALGDLASLPAEIFMAGYTKEQELEADRDGTTLAIQTGYSYRGILQLFEAFTKLETGQGRISERSAGPLGEAARLSLSTLSGYFASHPPSRQRMERIDDLAAERRWPTPPLIPFSDKGRTASPS